MRNFENRRKIVRVSGFLKIFCWLAMAGNALVGVYAAVGWAIMCFKAPPSISTDMALMAPFWVWYSPLACVIQFMAWRNFWIFFSWLKHGRIFDAPTVGRLMTAGKWMLAGWVWAYVPFAFYPPHGPIGWSGSGETGDLIGALAIIFVAWLLREGQTLQEEQELTV